VIRSNVIDSCEHLLEAAETFSLPLDPATKEAETAINAVLELEGCDRALKYGEIAVHIATLWADSGIQKCLGRKSEFYLLDSAPYFLKKAATLAGEEYLPSDEDVLRARSITTGVVTVDFTLKEGSRELKLELVDVGGQRGERRRWIHCFEGVTAVMFIISLSDYNQTLWEDDTTNRMQESEKLFGDMLNNVFFRETPFIVFFNKVDLFSEKLKTVPLTMAYKDYAAPNGDDKAKEEHALKFIQHKFLSTDRQNKNKNKDSTRVYPFHTTATDTELVKNVFVAVTDIIMNINLTQAGFQ